MKKITALSFMTLIVMLMLSSAAIMKAQAPSAALWLQQTDSKYDSTTKIYTIILEWENGLIDDEHPEPDGYNVYRSMVGHNEDPEDFEMVGTVTKDDMTDGVYQFSNETEQIAVYYYYVRGYKNDTGGEMSPMIMAFALGRYCVNLNAPIIDFASFPGSIAIPGEKYEYEAYAKHRSPRVQGFVRYALLEGPEGMTIDEKSGLLEWNVPQDADGDYYVKIRATSEEDERAESIQEWYIRTASDEEIESLVSSVNEISFDNSLLVYPSPANETLNFNFNAESAEIRVELISGSGAVVLNKIINVLPGTNSISIPVNNYTAGAYFLRITDNNKISTGKLIIE